LPQSSFIHQALEIQLEENKKLILETAFEIGNIGQNLGYGPTGRIAPRHEGY